MIEKFIESHWENKSQTREVYFLATNFEKTRIKDERINELQEKKKQRIFIKEENNLASIFKPEERRMRLNHVNKIRQNNFKWVRGTIKEILDSFDTNKCDLFSEKETCFLFELLGVNLNLDKYPKNLLFLYPQQYINEDLIKNFFINRKESKENLNLKQKDKFVNKFKLVERPYLESVLYEIILSRVIFDKAKKFDSEKKEKRQKLCKTLVTIRINDIMETFYHYLNIISESNSIDLEMLIDALNSIENKILKSEEIQFLINKFKKIKKDEKMLKTELIDWIITEKSKVLQKDIFNSELTLFENYILDSFKSFFSEYKNDGLTIEQFFEFIDSLDKVNLSSQQKFLLWSFFYSTGFVSSQKTIDLVNCVSVLSFYIQHTLFLIKTQEFMDYRNGDIKLEFEKVQLGREELNGFLGNDLFDFSCAVKKNFPHLKFSSDNILFLFQQQNFMKNGREVNKIFETFSRLKTINIIYQELLSQFILV